MKAARTISELRAGLAELRRPIGLVPTMGFLHAGHGSLIEEAKRQSASVIVSIFVNPLQFNNPRDLDTYPVSEEADLELCRNLGADLVFLPSRAEMYPERAPAADEHAFAHSESMRSQAAGAF
jgi:pantoate--beta-alanine ligase